MPHEKSKLGVLNLERVASGVQKVVVNNFFKKMLAILTSSKVETGVDLGLPLLTCW
jgi:hypothetical protein